MCRWMFDEIGPDVPLHFSRFIPAYLLKNLPPTPVSSLEKAWDIAKKAGMHYTYIGNVPGHEKENTYCPQCQNKIIQRRGYQIQQTHIKNGRCSFCNHHIPGVWT